MAQVVDGSIVLGTIFEAAGARDPKLFHKIAPDALRVLKSNGWPEQFGSVIDVKTLSLRFVSSEVYEWVWSPTSGSMYRRDAVALFADCESLQSLRYATDAFFNQGINSFTGSVLIDQALSAYRIHGDNLFTRHASLNQLLCFENDIDRAPLAAKLALLHILSNTTRFADKCRSPAELMRAMKSLGRIVAQRRWDQKQYRKYRTLITTVIRVYWKLKLKLTWLKTH